MRTSFCLLRIIANGYEAGFCAGDGYGVIDAERDGGQLPASPAPLFCIPAMFEGSAAVEVVAQFIDSYPDRAQLPGSAIIPACAVRNLVVRRELVDI